MKADSPPRRNLAQISCEGEALVAQLDEAFGEIESGDAHSAIETLVVSLNRLRSSLPDGAWIGAISLCRAHPIFRLLHRDPLTRRSYERPRGYPGDAVMLDMIYDHEAHGSSLAGPGRAVFQYTAGNGRSPKAVRNRRAFIGGMIDEICLHKKQARILSIAGGHLREAELSGALAERRIADWVAIDQDARSVDECRRRFAGLPIRPLRGSVRDLLAGRIAVGTFDFVYAAGLFDYLSDSIAKALVSTMASLLAPGGKLLLANFAHSHVDSAYMEAFMDWRLIYRTEEDMQRLLTAPGDHRFIAAAQFADQWNAILYAIGERAS